MDREEDTKRIYPFYDSFWWVIHRLYADDCDYHIQDILVVGLYLKLAESVSESKIWIYVRSTYRYSGTKKLALRIWFKYV